MRAAMICRADLIAIGVRQGTFDRVGAPFAAFIQQRRSGRAESVRRHVVRSIAHPPQRPIDRILAHRFKRRSEFRKNVTPTIAQFRRFPQDSDCLLRQRDAMRLALLHSFGGDRPERIVKIDLAPFRRSHLARSLIDVRREAQRQLRHRLAGIGVDRPQQLPEANRIGDGCMVLGDRRNQCTLQRLGRIDRRASRRYGVTENAAGKRSQASRRLALPRALYLF